MVGGVDGRVLLCGGVPEVDVGGQLGEPLRDVVLVGVEEPAQGARPDPDVEHADGEEVVAADTGGLVHAEGVEAGAANGPSGS